MDFVVMQKGKPMRPIDADALKEDHDMADDCPLCKQKVISCQYDIIYTKMDFCGWIDDAPTIEPERKPGKWIHHKPFDCEHHNCNTCIECSCCGTWFGADSYAQTNYCPNCGAYMRGEGGQDG